MEEKADVKKRIKMSCDTKGSNNACGGTAYVLGFIGAAVYYISTASGFWAGALGLLKAMVAAGVGGRME